MVPGIVAMALASNHHFPRHSHDQFGIGVMTFGAHRSWSGMGDVRAEAGDVIMVNPGEIHDGAPLDDEVRGWRMIYIDPTLFTREVSEEFEGMLELVRPVVRDPLLAAHSTGSLRVWLYPSRIAWRKKRAYCSRSCIFCGGTMYRNSPLLAHALAWQERSGTWRLPRLPRCPSPSWRHCRAYPVSSSCGPSRTK